MKTYTSIQILRFLAALLVVVSHSTQAISIRLHGGNGSDYWHAGTFGVDIFFVISGFIMASTTSGQSGYRSAWVFLLRRAIRLVPMYWLYTFLKLLIVAVAPSSSVKPFPTFEHLIASLFFIPHQDYVGNYWPVLPVGWTLCFEMLFYTAFAISIIVGGFNLIIVTLLFLLLGFNASIYPSEILNFFWDSILIEFLFGIVIARLNSYSLFQKPIFAKNSLPTIALLSIIVISILAMAPSSPRGIGWGIPAALVLIIAILLEPRLPINSIIQALKMLGDASYTLYLSHTFAVPAVVVAVGLMGVANSTGLVVLATGASLLAAVFLYRAVELPITRALQKRAPHNHA